MIEIRGVLLNFDGCRGDGLSNLFIRLSNCRSSAAAEESTDNLIHINLTAGPPTLKSKQGILLHYALIHHGPKVNFQTVLLHTGLVVQENGEIVIKRFNSRIAGAHRNFGQVCVLGRHPSHF